MTMAMARAQRQPFSRVRILDSRPRCVRTQTWPTIAMLAQSRSHVLHASQQRQARPLPKTLLLLAHGDHHPREIDDVHAGGGRVRVRGGLGVAARAAPAGEADPRRRRRDLSFHHVRVPRLCDVAVGDRWAAERGTHLAARRQRDQHSPAELGGHLPALRDTGRHTLSRQSARAWAPTNHSASRGLRAESGHIPWHSQ